MGEAFLPRRTSKGIEISEGKRAFVCGGSIQAGSYVNLTDPALGEIGTLLQDQSSRYSQAHTKAPMVELPDGRIFIAYFDYYTPKWVIIKDVNGAISIEGTETICSLPAGSAYDIMRCVLLPDNKIAVILGSIQYRGDAIHVYLFSIEGSTIVSVTSNVKYISTSYSPSISYYGDRLDVAVVNDHTFLVCNVGYVTTVVIENDTITFPNNLAVQISTDNSFASPKIAVIDETHFVIVYSYVPSSSSIKGKCIAVEVSENSLTVGTPTGLGFNYTQNGTYINSFPTSDGAFILVCGSADSVYNSYAISVSETEVSVLQGWSSYYPYGYGSSLKLSQEQTSILLPDGRIAQYLTTTPGSSYVARLIMTPSYDNLDALSFSTLERSQHGMYQGGALFASTGKVYTCGWKDSNQRELLVYSEEYKVVANNGIAMGIAESAGTTGDTISIYIPNRRTII